ncbi:MAG: ferritin [Gemmatimonadales bacterium]
MPNKAVESALNDQIRLEFESAYLYLSMAAYFESQNLPGFAHWMRVQHREELEHAMKLFDFLLASGGRVQLRGLKEPAHDFGSPVAVMEQTLGHEQSITAAITTLYELTLQEKDYPSQLVLQWFISEQAEEEKSVSDIIAQLAMVGDNKPAMLMMDRQLGSRQ